MVDYIVITFKRSTGLKKGFFKNNHSSRHILCLNNVTGSGFYKLQNTVFKAVCIHLRFQGSTFG